MKKFSQSPSLSKMQIKLLWLTFTSSERLPTKEQVTKQQKNKCWGGYEKRGTLIYHWRKCELVQLLRKIPVDVAQKCKNRIFYSLNPIKHGWVGIHQKELHACFLLFFLQHTGNRISLSGSLPMNG